MTIAEKDNLLLAFGSVEELDKLRKLYGFDSGAIKCLLNSHFSLSEQSLIKNIFRHAATFSWELILLNKIYMDKSLDQTTNFSVYDLTGTEQLILRRLYNRHIQATGNINLYEIISERMFQWIVGILQGYNITKVVCAQIPHQYIDYMLIPACRLLKIDIEITKSIQVYHSGAYRIWDPINNECKNTTSLAKYDKEKVIDFCSMIYGKLTKKSIPYAENRLTREKQLRSNVAQELSAILSADNQYSNKVCGYLSEKKDLMARLSSKSVNLYSISHDTNFLIVFLHFEPECNICPLGAENYDQLIFLNKINIICEKLGLKFLVREHPVQLRLPLAGLTVNQHFLLSKTKKPRDHTYYDLIESFSNFKGFCQDNTINEILDSSNVKITASVAGTVSLQSAIRGIPTVVGTAQWFDGLDLIYNIDELLSKLSINQEEPLELSTQPKIAPLSSLESALLNKIIIL